MRAMLLDLEKLVIKRTVIGIRCTVCGGHLIALRKSILCWTMRILSFGILKPQRYKCESCKKWYLLLRS